MGGRGQLHTHWGPDKELCSLLQGLPGGPGWNPSLQAQADRLLRTPAPSQTTARCRPRPLEPRPQRGFSATPSPRLRPIPGRGPPSPALPPEQDRCPTAPFPGSLIIRAGCVRRLCGRPEGHPTGGFRALLTDLDGARCSAWPPSMAPNPPGPEPACGGAPNPALGARVRWTEPSRSPPPLIRTSAPPSLRLGSVGICPVCSAVSALSHHWEAQRRLLMGVRTIW